MPTIELNERDLLRFDGRLLGTIQSSGGPTIVRLRVRGSSVPRGEGGAIEIDRVIVHINNISATVRVLSWSYTSMRGYEDYFYLEGMVIEDPVEEATGSMSSEIPWTYTQNEEVDSDIDYYWGSIYEKEMVEEYDKEEAKPKKKKSLYSRKLRIRRKK
jgi:hypothetical protein